MLDLRASLIRQVGSSLFRISLWTCIKCGYSPPTHKPIFTYITYGSHLFYFFSFTIVLLYLKYYLAIKREQLGTTHPRGPGHFFQKHAKHIFNIITWDMAKSIYAARGSKWAPIVGVFRTLLKRCKLNCVYTFFFFKEECM